MANPWERDWSGGGTIIPASPTTTRKNDADADRARSEAERAAADARVAQARAEADLAKAQADAAKAGTDAKVAAGDAENTPPPVTPEVRAARRTLQTDNVIDAINNARGNAGWSTTGNFFGSNAFGHVPVIGQGTTDLRSSLDTIKANLSFDALKQMREESKTGGALGSVTENELRLLSSAVASLDQAQSEDQLRNNLATVEKHYRRSMALMAGENPEDQDVAKRYGIVSATAPTPPTGEVHVEEGKMGPPSAPPTGGAPPSDPGQPVLSPGGRAENDPALAGVNSTVARMYQEGRSAQDIRSYLNRVRPGLGDTTTGIEEAVAYARQNPGVDMPVDVEQHWVPASGLSNAMGEFGMTPLGTGIIGAGDMFSFGTLDNLSSNPDMTRAVMTGLQERNPKSYFGGQVAGGVLSGIGAETALGRAGLGALGRARGGDLVLGGGYGAGSGDEGNRFTNAAFGGLFGLAGGAGGRTASRVVGRSVAGVTDPARRYLSERGVPLSVGQLLGGMTQRTEDRLAGLPWIGDRIGAMRREGVEGFNRAAFQEAMAPIGGTAGDVLREAGVEQAQNAVSEAYTNALGPARLRLDDQFLTDLAGADASIRRLPRVGGEVADSVEQVLDPSFLGSDDSLSGENMQALLRYLQGVRGGYSQDPLFHRIGQGVGQVEDSLTSMVDRQAPDVMPAYNAANEAFRNEEVLRDAVGRARNGGPSKDPGLFMPSQLMDAASSNASRFGNSRGTTRQPFFDLARAGQQALPSQVPDSGTAGRLSIPALLMGIGGYANADEGEGVQDGATGAATGAILTGLFAGPFASRTSRAAITRSLLADRNPTVRRIGEEIIANDRIAGLLAAPVAASAVGGP